MPKSDLRNNIYTRLKKKNKAGKTALCSSNRISDKVAFKRLGLFLLPCVNTFVQKTGLNSLAEVAERFSSTAFIEFFSF